MTDTPTPEAPVTEAGRIVAALAALADAHRLGREHRPCDCPAHVEARAALAATPSPAPTDRDAEWGFISPETGDFIGVTEAGMRKRWGSSPAPTAPLDVERRALTQRLVNALGRYAEFRDYELTGTAANEWQDIERLVARLTDPKP